MFYHELISTFQKSTISMLSRSRGMVDFLNFQKEKFDNLVKALNYIKTSLQNKYALNFMYR